MAKIVVYEGADEVLITTKNNEKQLIKDYFTKGGRSLEDYDRYETEENRKVVRIHNSLYANVE